MKPPSRRLLWLIWLLPVSLWLLNALLPLSNDLTRAAGIALSAVIFIGLLLLCWRVCLIRYALFVFAVLCSLVAILPGRSKVDVVALRASCGCALQRYLGVAYSWGGESFKGIDCSGLVRRGLVDGCFVEGVRTLNPGLVRQAFYVWWHDCTANQLGEGYLRMTRPLFQTSSINALNPARLLPGDLAVTRGGAHILAYLGDNNWIEADPTEGRVIQVKVPSANPWFDFPVTIVRWQILNPLSDSSHITHRLFPSEQTLVAIGRLPTNATLDDVLKITGQPEMDVGSAIHDYYFQLDDYSSIHVQTRLDNSLLSIEHQTAKGSTKIFPTRP